MNNRPTLSKYVIEGLRKHLRIIAKIHINEIDSRASLSNTVPDQIRQQMHLLAQVIQNLSSLNGEQ